MEIVQIFRRLDRPCKNDKVRQNLHFCKVAQLSEYKLKYKKIIGRSDAGATIPHGRVGLTLLLKYSFAKSADEGGRTVRRISALAFPPHKKITSEASTLI